MSSTLIPSPFLKKLDAEGYPHESNETWNDGFEYDGVKKIHVRTTRHGIQFVKFEYVKGGVDIPGDFKPTREEASGETYKIEINYPEEYLVSVDVWCDRSAYPIKKIQFKTNHRPDLEAIGGTSTVCPGRTLEVNGMKIIGFEDW